MVLVNVLCSEEEMSDPFELGFSAVGSENHKNNILVDRIDDILNQNRMPAYEQESIDDDARNMVETLSPRRTAATDLESEEDRIFKETRALFA